MKMEGSACCMGRCLCIHSQLQLVDLTMSALLLHHGVLPQPLMTISQPPPNGLVRTLNAIKMVQCELQEAFRSRHRRSISEVVIAVGPSPFRPLHTYRIPIDVCESGDSTHDACGSECGEMRPEEKRRVNLFLFKNFPPESSGAARGIRAFVFLRGADKLIGENMEESEFALPEERCTAVRFAHSTCAHPAAEPIGEHRWMRIVPFVVPGTAL